MSKDGIRTLAICLLLPAMALLLSLTLTHAIIPILKIFGMVDKPGDRHIHKTDCPRGGGIAIMASFLIVVIAYAFLGGNVATCQPSWQPIKLFLPLAIIIPLGIIDDKFRLPAKVKFLFQIIAAAFAWYLGVHIDLPGQWHIITPVNAFLTIFWITAMINAFNMIDGVDGLAGGIGGISAIALAFIIWFTGCRFNALILLIFAGSLMGFLYYNWHPAKIFMGDTGSMCIGYILGVAGLNATTQFATISAIVIPLLVCCVPALDIFLAVWRRIIAPVEDDPNHHLSFFERVLRHLAALAKADGNHLHHRLLTYYHKNQPKTVSSIYLLAIIMAFVGIIIYFIPQRLWWLSLIIVFASLAICIIRYATIELWLSTEIFFKNYQKPHFGLLLNLLNPVWDVCICTAAFIIARNHFDTIETAEFIIPVVLVFIVSRTYSVLWNYPSIEGYFHLHILVIGAFVISAIFNAIFQFYPFTLRDFAAAVGMADAAIICERMLFHALRMALIKQHVTAHYADKAPIITTLLYGICQEGRMYVKAATIDIDRACREKIIGFIDRNPRYSHSFCYGLRVLGTLQELAKIHEKHQVGKIVVCTDNLLPQERDELVKFCHDNNIRLSHYRCREQDYC
jgi:UDP-GlcNAc:undecaprenyl-phosphate GlcNAc-1-phosphate transferase